ncbi:MAG: hypothetical protein A4E53_01889 [Pelotomaculum sp. PtaB.Bin104]|nr:MAG: hypothetical protein A4E53_01889 [Pelotomaculum sp. PtaB.Bin104]
MKKALTILMALVFTLVMVTGAIANPEKQLPEQVKKVLGKAQAVTEDNVNDDLVTDDVNEVSQNNDGTNNDKEDNSFYPYEHKVNVNGKEVKFDVRPVIKDGRILIPVRAVMNQFGASIAWDETERTVTVAVYDPDKEVIFDLAEDKVYVDGTETEIDVPAQILEDRTIVPLRFLAETFGMKVNYHEDTGDVDIEDEVDQDESDLDENNTDEDEVDQDIDVDDPDENDTNKDKADKDKNNTDKKWFR